VAELKAQLDGAASQHQKAIAEKETQQSELALTIEGLTKEKNGIWGRCKELQARVDVLEKESGLLKTEKESHQAAEAELNKQLAEVKKQLDEKRNWYQKVVAEKEAQAKSESEKALTLLAEEANKSAKLLQVEKEAHQATTELAATKKELDEKTHWNQKHKDWAESLKREIETLKKDYAEGERAQGLALKLQAKAQVDLENLRAQYQQKLTQEQHLIELIRELQLKLQAAANYYHQLQLQHPELSTEFKQGNTNNAIDAEIISRPIASKRAHKKRK
jgi:chromosome segregation ATPase